jgi:hypothetical protein
MSHYPVNRLERVRDLRRVVTGRYGRRLPNNETGRKYLAIVIDHALLTARDLADRMAQQLAPPEVSDAELAYLIDIAGAGRMWEPHDLAKAIDLREAERVRLEVRTIAAVDMTRKQRKNLKNKRKRLEKLAAAAAQAQSPDVEKPIRAEQFSAMPNSPQVACLTGLRQADVVLLVLGRRYGEPLSNGLSPTHEEFNEARTSKPLFVFVQSGIIAR